MTLGASPVITLKRERAQLDRANVVIGSCATFYGDLKAGLE